MCDLSVVVPVYKCTSCLGPLHRRLTATLSDLVDDYEILLVDDGGGEGAWSTIADLARSDSRLRGIAMSRNFGQHAAITAGLTEARGARVVVMDCDLQEPPELIRQLHAKADEGFDVVYTRRRRKSTSLARRLFGRVYFRILNWMTGAGLSPDHGTLSLISRRVVDAFTQFRERDRHYLYVLKWLGFEAAEVEYEQEERLDGGSSYSLRALFRHAIAGMFFQTTRLLRWVLYVGLLIALTALAMASYFLVARLSGSALPGWTSLAIFTLGVGSVTITSVGIVGLYVARIFEEIRGRPLFVVARTTDDETDGPSSNVTDRHPTGELSSTPQASG